MSTASAIGMSSIFAALRRNTVATTATIHNATALAGEMVIWSMRRGSCAVFTTRMTVQPPRQRSRLQPPFGKDYFSFGKSGEPYLPVRLRTFPDVLKT